MAVIHDVPNEILLHFFPLFCLKSLIASRGVCKLWKQFVRLADIHSSRHGLLRLYKMLIRSPAFIQTRPWPLENLKPFDRQAYIDALLDQHNDLPEDFRIWILEWPAQATINCAWPGLPAEYCTRTNEAIDRIEGFNWLGRVPPLVHTIQLDVSCMDTWIRPREAVPDWDTDDENGSDITAANEDLAKDAGHIEVDVDRDGDGAVILNDSDVPPAIWIEVPALLIHQDSYNKTWLVLDAKWALPYGIYALLYEEYDGDDGFNHVEN
ncbi:hypothetical protein B0H10DRAFT_2210121 [Mycena sp. CBHHK59/15]|nr:hypothetical protein B0H10DRAFT_2210121 [Mycena sp. CBHHK59/15]